MVYDLAPRLNAFALCWPDSGGYYSVESSYNPVAESEAKKQRALGREIRATKREAALAPDEDSRRKAKEDIQLAQQKLKTHLNETGRTRQSYREQLHFADGGTVNPRGVKPSTPPPSTMKAQSTVNQIPDESDKETWKNIG